MEPTNRTADQQSCSNARLAARRLRTGCIVSRLFAASIALACIDAADTAPTSAALAFQTIAILAAIIASTAG